MPTIIHPSDKPAEHARVVTHIEPPEPFTLVIFGGTGDLAARKLLPALFTLWQQRHLPANCAIVGVGRRPKTNDAYRADVQKALTLFRHGPTAAEEMHAFLAHVHYQQADAATHAGMAALARDVQQLETSLGLPGNRLFYLATDPALFAPTIEGLASAGLVHRETHKPWVRVVIEKPFGHDLASARKLDHDVLMHLRRDQAYRIDHYLGKETVQNLLAFRFGNAIFEPLFNRMFVDHVQITVAETVGMEGQRGAFYDHAGALRDVVQNHMLQLLALVAMDPPATLQVRDIRDAKVKVLRDLLPIHGEDVGRRVVRGQYGAGSVDGRPVKAYREEDGVVAGSSTETYVAMRVEIESWRWAGVPFLLRTGKRLTRRATEIAVQFKLPPLRLFRTVECVGDVCDLSAAQPAVLAFRIQPNEGISLAFSAKRPGMQLDLSPVRFDFDYQRTFNHALPEAYERLLLDALRGDATLFMSSEELLAAWEFVTPILDAWQREKAPHLPNYAAGTWGPHEAVRLAEGLGGWREP
jgi:glucose-6-phosphate 1-dehydrogenase